MICSVSRCGQSQTHEDRRERDERGKTGAENEDGSQRDQIRGDGRIALGGRQVADEAGFVADPLDELPT